jgi:hypothetical protein
MLIPIRLQITRDQSPNVYGSCGSRSRYGLTRKFSALLHRIVDDVASISRRSSRATCTPDKKGIEVGGTATQGFGGNLFALSSDGTRL